MIHEFLFFKRNDGGGGIEMTRAITRNKDVLLVLIQEMEWLCFSPPLCTLFRLKTIL